MLFFAVLCKILASKMNVIFGIIQSDIVLQITCQMDIIFDKLSDTRCYILASQMHGIFDIQSGTVLHTHKPNGCKF